MSHKPLSIVQNVYGTVYGSVVGGNHIQEGDPAPEHSPPSVQELRECVREAKALRRQARLGKFFNLPAALALVGLAFCVWRLLALLAALGAGAAPAMLAVQLQAVQLQAVAGLAVTAGFVAWLKAVQRRHNITIAYAQGQIDEAELALRLARR